MLFVISSFKEIVGCCLVLLRGENWGIIITFQIFFESLSNITLKGSPSHQRGLRYGQVCRRGKKSAVVVPIEEAKEPIFFKGRGYFPTVAAQACFSIKKITLWWVGIVARLELCGRGVFRQRSFPQGFDHSFLLLTDFFFLILVSEGISTSAILRELPFYC